jgi:uncharacterized protein (UPF0335 family)
LRAGWLTPKPPSIGAGGFRRPTSIINIEGRGLLQEAPAMGDFMVEELGEAGRTGGHVAADELKLLIERAERLEEEKKGISDDIKDVMGEAKSRGYDPKAIRKILSIRKKKKEEYQEEEAILEVYMQALGMI